MRYIEMETWSRREQFGAFSTFDHPHFGMCANVDLTAFYPMVKPRGHSLTVAIVYVLARASNAIPEFRHRIRAGSVVEHEVVHPGFTILVDEDRFSFCMVDYAEDYAAFAARAAERIAFVKEHPWVNHSQRDDVLYMTAIPWVSFTSFMHPMPLQSGDSVPRFAWGKFFDEGNALKMPLAVQGHHALLDGVHIGKFYAKIQDYLHQPELVLGEAIVPERILV